MKVPKDPELIKNETILLNGTYYPIIELVFVPGTYSDQTMTRFNWTFVKFTQKELLIQLDFEHLSYISARNTDPDSIRAIIYGF